MQHSLSLRLFWPPKMLTSFWKKSFGQFLTNFIKLQHAIYVISYYFTEFLYLLYIVIYLYWNTKIIALSIQFIYVYSEMYLLKSQHF
jgi:hypothetical protein